MIAILYWLYHIVSNVLISFLDCISPSYRVDMQNIGYLDEASVLDDSGVILSGDTGGHLNIKISYYQHRDSHYIDKTVLWLSYLYNGNPTPVKTAFILRWDPVSFQHHLMSCLGIFAIFQCEIFEEWYFVNAMCRRLSVWLRYTSDWTRKMPTTAELWGVYC